MPMIVTSLVMAALIAIGIYAFIGLQRQERERLAAGRVGAASASSEEDAGS